MRKFNLLFVLLAALAISTHGQWRDLDPTFGGTGIVNTGYMFGLSGLAIQPDGKILVGGGSNCDFALARYRIDGSLDTAFNDDGIVTTDLGSCDGANSIALQPDGKLVVVGLSFDEPSHQYFFAAVRYNAGGSLDTSLDGDGKVIMATGGTVEPWSVALQSNGKIVIAGTVYVGNRVVEVVRLNADGSLDTTFDGDGKVITNLGGDYDYASSVALQPDGKIVVAGSALVRYNSNGSLDASFDGDGIVTTGGRSVALQPDGKIVVAGQANSGLSITRYNSDGSLDMTFDGDGSTTIGGFGSWANSVVLRPGGKIVAAGTSSQGTGYFDSALVLVTCQTDGSLDAGFGRNGIAIIGGEDQEHYGGNAVAIDSQGRIIVVGSDPWFGGYSAAYRFIASSRTPFDFDGDDKSDISVFRPSNSVWYFDRSTEGFSATHFGTSTDKIVSADYDGDGTSDIAVYRNGAWWIMRSTNEAVESRSFGITNDTPVPADYTGDGRDELAVYRSGQWWTLDLSNDESSLLNFGLAGDKPVAADYDGDGRVDQAVYRNGEWHINRSTLGYTVMTFGLASDSPVVGDYDGDGRADLAVYRDGTWYLQQSTAGFTAVQWGLASDTPVPGDYDGDGETDAAIFRSGTWYINQTTGAPLITSFGIDGDRPVPNAYVP